MQRGAVNLAIRMNLSFLEHTSSRFTELGQQVGKKKRKEKSVGPVLCMRTSNFKIRQAIENSPKIIYSAKEYIIHILISLVPSQGSLYLGTHTSASKA
jgi:hypothetical protein